MTALKTILTAIIVAACGFLLGLTAFYLGGLIGGAL